MLISYNWLKQYIDLPDSVTPEEVAHRLTMSTVEVESVKKVGEGLDKVVVGKILSVDAHPNADKLRVCKVDVGSEQIQLVCGGSNLAVGMLVVVAKLGAWVKWHGQGDPVEMKEAELRGVKSYGMICGASEVGLTDMFPPRDDHEIVDLTGALKNNVAVIGKPIAEALALSDAIIEIDNKSMTNRPDLWGHYGIAREVAALFKKELKVYPHTEFKAGEGIKLKAKVEDAKLCPRYMAVAISGVKIAPSPEWLQRRLVSIGLRPINNIVDITNYIMYDLGEPMHAFDKSKVESLKSKVGAINIVVRRAQDGEKFKTLDGREHQLDSSMLVIANEEKSLALAGVMGGEESGISDTTTDIIFEAANFEPVTIRKAAVKLGLRTDSSARFEKSLDPNLCEQALNKAVELTLQVCPEAKVASKIADEKHFKLYQGPIEVAWEFLDKKIGIAIEHKEIINILERLGFEVKEKKSGLSVKIPTWRATKDISMVEDFVEEVARVYGYDNIATKLPNFPINPPEKNKLRALENSTRTILAIELGYNEIYNYSFVSVDEVNKLGDDLSKYIELDNPIAKDRPYLRRNLLTGLLNNIRENAENFSTVNIFEIGKVFHANEAGVRAVVNSDELLPRQDSWVTAMFSNRKDKMPYWKVRRSLENLMAALNVDWKLKTHDNLQSWEHPTRLALVEVDGRVVGVVGELHPVVGESFGLDSRVGMLQLNLSVLSELLPEQTRSHYQVLPKFPPVVRDIAFVVKKTVAHAHIVKVLSDLDPLLRHIELFDVYEGETIGHELKSMAYRLTFINPERTLKSEEVDAVMSKVVTVLEKLEAEVRK